MNKWDRWYDNLPEATKQYLSSQPVWHDRDMFVALAIGLVVGLVIGLIY